MYNFVDTNGYAEGTSLPSEALKINGAYLEHTVTGYRTLYVKGREMLAPDIETYETGVRDGSTSSPSGSPPEPSRWGISSLPPLRRHFGRRSTL